MPTVGERLKAERERRTMSLEDMAAATGIGREFLDALERDDIRVLPGKAFGKLYIRAYAEVLEFDPKAWIEDYDRERRFDPEEPTAAASAEPVRPRAMEAAIARWKDSKMKERIEDAPPPEDAPSEAAPPTTDPVTATPEASPAPKRRVGDAAILGLGIGALVVLAFVISRFVGHTDAPAAVPTPPPQPSTRPRPVPPSPSPTPSPIPTPAPGPTSVPVPTPSPAPTPSPTPSPALPPASSPPPRPTASDAAGRALSVSEFRLGRRIVNLQVVGEGDRFEPMARVTFQTRVLGGARGDVIRHVWIRDGRVEQSIPLHLGGPDYRTHSSKTLGHEGAWVVEARDPAGAVLARVAFACGPQEAKPSR